MRWLLCALLILTCRASLAEHWVRYTQTSQANHYYDRERTLEMGGTAFIWDLHDLKGEGGAGSGESFRSVLYAVEVNCRREQRRVLSYHRMSGAMGAGQVVEEHSLVSDWMAAAPQTPEARLMAIACDPR